MIRAEIQHSFVSENPPNPVNGLEGHHHQNVRIRSNHNGRRPPTWKRLGLTPESWRDRQADVLVRDRNRCVYCRFQGGSDGENLTVDHVVPLSLGGSTKPKNLAACCFACNQAKGNQMPLSLPEKRLKNGRLPTLHYQRIYEMLIKPRLVSESV